MATINMDMPALDGSGERVVVVITVADAAVSAVVQATCEMDGYTGPEPGMYTLQKTVGSWVHAAREYNIRNGRAIVESSVAAMIAPLEQTVVMEKDGKVVTKDDIAGVAQVLVEGDV